MCPILEWIEMCHKARNMERFGVTNPTKEERHVQCRKEHTDESSTTSSCASYDARKTVTKQKEQVNSYFSNIS